MSAKRIPAISGNLMVKSKMPPQIGSHSSFDLEAVEHHSWKGP